MSIAASVTIPYTEFQALQDARKAAEIRIAKLQDQIRSGRIEESNQTALAVARAAIEVVRYAVASLPPESNVGWPSEALRAIAAGLPSMPDTEQDDQELATTFLYFADQIDLYEKRRRALASPDYLERATGVKSQHLDELLAQPEPDQ